MIAIGSPLSFSSFRAIRVSQSFLSSTGARGTPNFKYRKNPRNPLYGNVFQLHIRRKTN